MRMRRCKSAFIYVYLRFYFFMDIPMIFELHYSRVIEIMMTVLKLPLPSPSWYSGRLWLLRVGYYKLTRPKEQADDWVWIVDHTIQIGAEKVFVILGIRLNSLPLRGNCVTHLDVEPISLYPCLLYTS